MAIALSGDFSHNDANSNERGKFQHGQLYEKPSFLSQEDFSAVALH
ncbi:MAG: hypothetical protein KDN19_04120 [Verrucomicrobiae bacterium]|nr:hypothetical protein [Verrucomicrobiae bacterium]